MAQQKIVGEIKKIEIKRKRGDNKSLIMTFLTSKGVPLPIAGASFIMSVTNTASPTAPDYVFQSTGVIIDVNGGRVRFPITALDADNVGNFFYDVQMIDSSSETSTILEGKYTVTQDRTK